jgi:hypothetical protein
MKKVYIQPLTTVEKIKIKSFLQTPSISDVNGSAGITKGEGAAPTTADAKGRGYYEDESSFGDLW